MKNDYKEEEVIVHPVDGMQIAEGYIREDRTHHFFGIIPGLRPVVGNAFMDVLKRLDMEAKEYFGDDVVVEMAHHLAA